MRTKGWGNSDGEEVLLRELLYIFNNLKGNPRELLVFSYSLEIVYIFLQKTIGSQLEKKTKKKKSWIILIFCRYPIDFL
jgi:hypothetical protein